MRLFITEKIKALLFIIFAIFSFVSLISFNPNDSGINFVGNNNEITNMMGIFGAYFSSTLYAFLGYSSYLIPIFFIIHGSISLLKSNNKRFPLKLLIFFLGIIFLNYSIFVLDNSFSLLSVFLNDITSDFLNERFYSKFFSQLISSVLGLFSIFLII